jgi:hypothetical protein
MNWVSEMCGQGKTQNYELNFIHSSCVGSSNTPNSRHPRAGGDPCDHPFILSILLRPISPILLDPECTIRIAEIRVDPRLRGDDEAGCFIAPQARCCMENCGKTVAAVTKKINPTSIRFSNINQERS